MKKAVLIYILLLSNALLYSQTISLSSTDSVFYLNANETFSTNLIVESLSESTIPIKINRQNVYQQNGSSNYFCWYYCYLPNINTSTVSIDFQPYESNDTLLSVYYNAGAECGKTKVKYCAFNENNTSDSSCVTVTYIVPSDINDTIINSCDSVLLENTTFYESGVYSFKHINQSGCDSILTYDLQINHQTVSEIYLSGCDSILFNDSVYYESGENTTIYISSKGCDSVIVTYFDVLNDSLELTFNNQLLEILEEPNNVDWYFNDKIIQSNGDFSFDPLLDGIYYASIESKYGCIIFSNAIHISPLTLYDYYYQSDKYEKLDLLGRKTSNSNGLLFNKTYKHKKLKLPNQ